MDTINQDASYYKDNNHYNTRYIITDEFYNNRTYDMLLKQITSEETDYIRMINDTVEHFLFQRWRMIVCSLPSNYYNQYARMTTSHDRNDWLQRYLDYPTKDITMMPEIL